LGHRYILPATLAPPTSERGITSRGDNKRLKALLVPNRAFNKFSALIEFLVYEKVLQRP